MKEKITKLSGFTFAALMIMLLSLFSFNAKAQQQAFAVPKDTLYVVNSALAPSQSYQTRYFTVPAGVTELRIQCWGAGAAGAYVEEYPRFGAGGGGGAYSRKNVVSVTPGDVLTIEIGAGGLTDKNGRGAGGNTTVKKSDGTIIVKAAGAPGLAVNQKDKGKGGKVGDCIGDVHFAGGKGGAGMDCEVGGFAGAGGGAAGNDGSGGNGEDATASWFRPAPGNPGNSTTTISGSLIPGKGGDAGGFVTSWCGDNGGDGNNYGAGGGGGIGGLINPYHGGAGANGAVLITYDDCSATAGAIALSATGCYKHLVNSVSAAGAPGTYFWEKSKDNTNWTVIPGATNDNYIPSDTAYYRRGYTTRCGNSVITLAQYVEVGFPSPGYVALTASPATTSWAACKGSTVDLSLSVYSSSIAQVKWQKSVNQGASWSDISTYKLLGDPMVVSEPNVQVETWYRAVYEPSSDCVLPTSNQFVLKVEDGVIGRPDFWFDTTTVYATLRYGEKDLNLYVFRPHYEPQGTVLLTNNKSVLNEGRLLGPQGPGTYTIDWTLTDCGAPKTYTKKYVISYPDCNELLTARDYDGYEYNSVRINANCWTKENMRSQHYNLGDTVRGNYVYESAQYPDPVVNLATYGRLYTWYSAIGIPEGTDDVPVKNIFGHIVGLCPSGWFLPDATLMADLNSYLSKDLRTINLWLEDNGTNLSGMSAKPAGCMNGENSRFEDLHISSYFWTSQEVILEKSLAFWIDCHCSVMQLKEFSKHDAMSVRCVKENTPTLPTVIEYQPVELSNYSALFSGDVIDGGGLNILERGFCYSTTPMPELNDGHSTVVVNDVPACGPLMDDVEGLSLHTVYYVRAYAKNALGTAYSEQKIFSLTSAPDTITFEPNGATNVMLPQLVARGVSTPLRKCVFSYPMSVFKGWSTTPTGPVVYTDQANITTSGNVKLYAQWYVPTHKSTTVVACGHYTWTEGNGKTWYFAGTFTDYYAHIDEHGCTQVDTLYLTVNLTHAIITEEEVMLGPGDSYPWRGRSLTETGAYRDTLKTVCCDCDSIIGLNLTVNTPIYDSVFYDANGGSGTTKPQQFTRGVAKALRGNGFTHPTGKFKCWNTQPNGSGTSYDGRQTITTTGNMTLYAQWYLPQHQSTTVSECNSYTWVGGTGATYNISGTYTYPHTDEHGCTQVDTLHLTIYKGFFKTETASISASYTPYEWVGHNKSYYVAGTYYDSLKTIHNCDSVYKLILTVTDSVKKTITFRKNDGTDTTTTQNVNINMPTALNPNTYTNSYLRFDGWNTQPNGSGTSYTDRQVVTITENLTLYAQWGSWCDGNPRIANEAGNGRVDSVKDHQNNWYEVVQIGTQCWLKENMRATTSPSGLNIIKNPMVYNHRSRAAGYYDNEPANGKKYGVMYNWCAMMDVNKSSSSQVASSNDDSPYNNPNVSTDNHRGICPQGWHIPTVDEWSTMTTYAGVSVSASSSSTGKNGVGKLAGSGWDRQGSGSENGYPGNLSYTYHNSTGFTALPGGFYCKYSSGFAREDECTHFWVARSNHAEVRCITYSNKYLYIEKEDGDGTHVYKRDASYVRCVRNAE